MPENDPQETQITNLVEGFDPKTCVSGTRGFDISINHYQIQWGTILTTLALVFGSAVWVILAEETWCNNDDPSQIMFIIDQNEEYQYTKVLLATSHSSFWKDKEKGIYEHIREKPSIFLILL